MENTKYPNRRSSLALKAERLLANDSILTSSSSEDVKQATSVLNDNNNISYIENRLPRNGSLSKAKKHERHTSLLRNDEASSPKLKEKKSKSKNSKKTLVHVPDTIGCHREKCQMKLTIEKLQKTIDSQQKRMKDLYKKIEKEKNETKGFIIEHKESRKKEMILKDLQEKLEESRNNELNLIKEVNDQQKIAKEALNKLYELQEESINEIEKVKNYYKDYYNRHFQEEKDTINDRIRVLEARIKILEEEKEEYIQVKLNEGGKHDQLINHIKKLEDEINKKTYEIEELINEQKQYKRENERLKAENDILNKENKMYYEEKLYNTNKNNEKILRDISKLRNENDKLHNENDKLRNENDRLCDDNENLKQQLIDNEHYQNKEHKRLRDTISELQQELCQIRLTKNDENTKDIIDKNYLKKMIDELTKENEEKSRLLKEKDISYKEQLELIDNKVRNLQTELKKMSQYELKMEEMSKELAKTKKYYKEKLDQKKRAQQLQKVEWSNIYNELLAEIRQLKIEIDGASLDNRK